MQPHGYRFGDFALDLDACALLRGDESFRLQPKTFDVLRYLVENAGRLVTKQELLDAVWPGVVVTENSLTRCIKDVRRALDDDVDAPRYVETLPRKGYRFLVAPLPLVGASPGADATPVPGASDAGPAPPAGVATPTDLRRPRFRRLAFAAAFAAAALVLLALAYYQPWHRAQQPASIAVLPFTNLSDDPAARYFADGVAEDLLDLLAGAPGLQVAARTSSFAFRDAQASTKAIARELGVRWLVRGSVRREGARVRVHVQLIDAVTGYEAWSQRYDRPVGELFLAQGDIAGAVGAQVTPRLAGAARPRLDAGTTDLDAYQEYMLGRDYLNRRPIGWAPRALAAFRAALERDPQFARAQAGLATVLAIQGSRLAVGPTALAQAEAAARRALELDPRLGSAHAALGLLALDDSPADAEQRFRQALALDPQLSSARSWLSSALEAQGRPEEARRELEAGLRIDPLNPLLIENYANAFTLAGDYAGARAVLERLLRLPQPPAAAYIRLSNLSLTHGRLVDALQWAFEWERRAPADQGDARQLIPLVPLVRLGYLDEANRRLAVIARQPLHAGWLGEAERALRSLGRAGELRPEGARLLRESGDEAPRLLRWFVGRIEVMGGDDAAGIALLAPSFPAGGALDRDAIPAAPPVGPLLAADTWMWLAYALQRTGRTAEARSHLARIDALLAGEERGGRAGTPDLQYVSALVAAMLGRTDDAIARFTAARRGGFNDAPFARRDPRWGAVLGDPRMTALLATAERDVAAQRREVDARIARGDPAFASLRRQDAAQPATATGGSSKITDRSP